MERILLVEPAYRSKFPPLGLMRLSTYHKEKGDFVVFVRGLSNEKKDMLWDRIYVSSLFTWELPRTVKVLKYYSNSVSSPRNLFVGGIGVTLFPTYVSERVKCRIVHGLLDKPNQLGRGSRAIAKLPPDYDLLHAVDHKYTPTDAYFARVTQGCIRNCSFCAVPRLEPEFRFLRGIAKQIGDVDKKYGSKQDLIILDNNILASGAFEDVVSEIVDMGFHVGAKRKQRRRVVDFNQGLDARLICSQPPLTQLLRKLCLKPVRLAFDHMSLKSTYSQAVALLAEEGFREFTNYMLFNHNDTPREFHARICFNSDLNKKYGIRITGFPMRFIPMTGVSRRHVAPAWKWRYLRGIQCVLVATRGLVSPNPSFVSRAFGPSFEKFIEIICMPDRYIIHRKKHEKDGAADWRKCFRKLSSRDKNQLLDILEVLNRSREKAKDIRKQPRRFWRLLEHYYPNGHPVA